MAPAMSDAVEGTVEQTETVAPDNTIYLSLGTASFECRRVSVTYQMMRFAKAQRDASATIPHPREFEDDKHREICKSCGDVAKKRNEAGMSLMVTMLDTIMILLRPSERDRFEEFMSTAELEPNELENAIGEVIAAVGGGEGKAKGTSSPSTHSDTKTEPSSRTVSFKPVTEAHQDVT